MNRTPIVLEAEGLRLVGRLSHPQDGPEERGRPPGLVLGHGFPRGPGGAATCGRSYPELADRLAAETGWVILTFNHRGTGESPGQFSLRGWMADLRAAADALVAQDVSAVWSAGAGTGGALAICHAAVDERVRGVASLGAPADFDRWQRHPDAFLSTARAVGVIRDKDFPPDPEAWAEELREVRPLAAAAKIPPRPFLVVHGDADDQVPPTDARALADTAGAGTELRIVNEADHLLRHDPRAVAVLMGWMARQWPGP